MPFLKLMEFGQRFFGVRILSAFLRPTFYKQFVSGDKPHELSQSIDEAQKFGIRLMLCPVQEEDVGGNKSIDQHEYGLRGI